jgi:hypothetical protein
MPAQTSIAASEIERVVSHLVERARSIQVIDQVSYDMAVACLRDVIEREAVIIEHHKPIKEAAHKAHREACNAEKRLLDPVQEAKIILRRSIADWETEQERIRREEERKAAAAAAREEEEMRLAMALEAGELGASEETIDLIAMTELPLPRPVVPPTFRRAAGISTRVTYRAEVVDIKAVCRAVADGKLSPEYVLPNQPALNRRAAAEKESLQIPGVRIVRDTGITTRRT